MYPGPSGSPQNHRKGMCSDGVKQAMKNDVEWPQPLGIFTSGTEFHPIKFLQVLRDVYETMVIRGGDGRDSALEYEAFLKMLRARLTTMEDGHHLFKLFDTDLQIPATTPDELIVEHDGSRYLRVDCLREDDHSSGTEPG
jgi:hypothetical protein